jgi:gamma-glutamylputrescine oxidase
VSRQPHQAPTVIGVGWDDDPWVAAWPGLPPLPGDRTADACVVGLGASGLAAAADRGLRVIGVDTGRVAAGAAGRNGGLLLGGGALHLHQALRSGTSSRRLSSIGPRSRSSIG